MEDILREIIDKYTEGDYLLGEENKKQMINDIIDLWNVVGKLSLKEIEMVVKLKHYDDWVFGNDNKKCEELIEETRNRIGYTKNDVKKYLLNNEKKN